MENGVMSIGIKCPIIREGDNIVDIVIDSLLKEEHWIDEGIDYYGHRALNNKDVIGITESVIARAAGQYITVDDIANDIKKKFGENAIIALISPIYSRNRFSLILKGIARAAKRIIFIMPDYDEVGNPKGINPFTSVNIEDYYKEICDNEHCESEFVDAIKDIDLTEEEHNSLNWIDCRLHLQVHLHDHTCYDWTDICSNVSPDWGVLGTNKATEDRLKLFPSKEEAQRICDEVKKKIKEKTGKDVIVCCYGDGCFKDPVGGIWEFADPVTMPAYTDKELMESTPHEIKLKAMIDSQNTDKSKNSFNDDIIFDNIHTIKEINKIGSKMESMGTTPRLYRDLLASLMDLTSGSGDKATPVILIQNYF